MTENDTYFVKNISGESITITPSKSTDQIIIDLTSVRIRDKCKDCIIEILNGLEVKSSGYRAKDSSNFKFKYCPECGNKIDCKDGK